jgi:hypothetical protein
MFVKKRRHSPLLGYEEEKVLGGSRGEDFRGSRAFRVQGLFSLRGTINSLFT